MNTIRDSITEWLKHNYCHSKAGVVRHVVRQGHDSDETKTVLLGMIDDGTLIYRSGQVRLSRPHRPKHWGGV